MAWRGKFLDFSCNALEVKFAGVRIRLILRRDQMFGTHFL